MQIYYNEIMYRGTELIRPPERHAKVSVLSKVSE